MAYDDLTEQWGREREAAMASATGMTTGERWAAGIAAVLGLGIVGAVLYQATAKPGKGLLDKALPEGAEHDETVQLKIVDSEGLNWQIEGSADEESGFYAWKVRYVGPKNAIYPASASKWESLWVGLTPSEAKTRAKLAIDKKVAAWKKLAVAQGGGSDSVVADWMKG